LVCISLFAYNFLDVSDREKQYKRVFAYWSRARELRDAYLYSILREEWKEPRILTKFLR
jgi:hypothetical protein